eukprot:10758268-Karenia_brevis.AAC.1
MEEAPREHLLFQHLYECIKECGKFSDEFTKMRNDRRRNLRCRKSDWLFGWSKIYLDSYDGDKNYNNFDEKALQGMLDIPIKKPAADAKDKAKAAAAKATAKSKAATNANTAPNAAQ